MNEPVLKIPAIGEQYEHHSKHLYTVLAIANRDSDKPDYPVSVLYMGTNGKLWVKTMQRFHETMRSTGTYNNGEMFARMQQIKAAFLEGYAMANDRMTWDESKPCWSSPEEAWANSDAQEPFEGL